MCTELKPAQTKEQDNIPKWTNYQSGGELSTKPYCKPGLIIGTHTKQDQHEGQGSLPNIWQRLQCKEDRVSIIWVQRI